jgi:hypothetical protein
MPPLYIYGDTAFPSKMGPKRANEKGQFLRFYYYPNLTCHNRIEMEYTPQVRGVGWLDGI